MAIREKIVIDAADYMSGLSGAEKAAIKFARKQDRLFRQNEQTIQSLTTEIKQLKRARDASNSTASIKKYDAAIEALEKQQRQLRQETDKYKRSVGDVERQTDKSSKGMTQSFKKIGTAAKMWLAGAAVGALLAVGRVLRNLSTEQMAFDEAMTKSLAIQGKVTLEQKNQMVQTARDVSRELNIASDKVAEGYFYLASAGLDVEQQIANIGQVAQFAKAGKFDLATATDLLTDAQSALGLTVKDTVENQENMIRVSDVLAKANQQANATIQQFSESLTNKAGTALKNYNKDVEEGVAVLAAYADQGVKDRLAGERLNILLKRLAEQANNNADAFEEMNVQVFDSEGNYRNIADIVEDLEGLLGDMTAQQRQAALAQLGFTAESQDSVLALIGLSDKIREYESALREAGGTTQEIADNQLGSLNERLGLMWRELNDRFGPTLNEWLSMALSVAEDLVDTISRATNTRFQNMIANLEDIGGDQEVIVKLKRLQAITEAVEMRKELQDELSQISVPVDIETKGASGKLKETLNEIGLSLTTPITQMGTRTRDIWKALTDDYKILEEGFSMDKMDEYKRGQEQLIEYQEEIIKKAIEFEQQGEDEKAEGLHEYSNTVNDVIEKLTTAINKAEQLKAVEDTIASIDESGLEDDTGDSGGGADDVVETTEKAYMGIKKVEVAWKELSDTIDLGTDSIIKTHLDEAAQSSESFNNTMTRLNNEYKTGAINQAEYENAVEKASDTYLKKLKQIYEAVGKQLSPAQQKLFKELIGDLGKTENSAEKAKASLGDIAESLNSILSLADAFGDVDENLKNVIRGSVDLLRNLEAIQKLDGSGFMNLGGTGLSGAIPAIGAAAGIATIASGFFDDSETKERISDLKNSMEGLKRAVERNTEAFYEEATVGSDIPQEDIGRGNNLVEGVVNGINKINWAKVFIGQESSLRNTRDRLAELGELFPEIFGDTLDTFNNLVAQGDYGGAMGYLRTLPGIFEEMADSVGEYGQSVAGAQQLYADSIRYGAQSAEEAFDLFIKQIEEAGLDLSQSVDGKTLAEWMKEFNAAETTKEERDEIVQMLWESRESLIPDNWSNDEFAEWLETLKGHDPSESGVGSEEGFSKSVQFDRTITDIQANEMIVFLEWIGEGIWELVDLSGGERMSLGNVSSNARGGLNIELPLPVRVENWQDATGHIGATTNNLNVGGIQVDGRFLMSDEEFEDLVSRIASELRTEMKGRTF